MRSSWPSPRSCTRCNSISFSSSSPGRPLKLSVQRWLFFSGKWEKISRGLVLYSADTNTQQCGRRGFIRRWKRSAFAYKTVEKWQGVLLTNGRPHTCRDCQINLVTAQRRVCRQSTEASKGCKSKGFVCVMFHRTRGSRWLGCESCRSFDGDCWKGVAPFSHLWLVGFKDLLILPNCPFLYGKREQVLTRDGPTMSIFYRVESRVSPFFWLYFFCFRPISAVGLKWYSWPLLRSFCFHFIC